MTPLTRTRPIKDFSIAIASNFLGFFVGIGIVIRYSHRDR